MALYAYLRLRFYDIAWGPPSEGYPKGVVAGAFENGSLEVWDAEKLIAGADAEDALISQTTKHTGPVKTVQFNPHKPEYLATASTILITRPDWATRRLDQMILSAWLGIERFQTFWQLAGQEDL